MSFDLGVEQWVLKKPHYTKPGSIIYAVVHMASASTSV